MPIGYSGKTLASKLGVKPGQTWWRSGMPPSIGAEISAEMPDIHIVAEPYPDLGAAHIFTASRSELADKLGQLRALLAPSGMVWLSWPKKSSGVPSEITEDVIRQVALPLGFVDVKVCAVDETWSGLKLVIRKELRK